MYEDDDGSVQTFDGEESTVLPFALWTGIKYVVVTTKAKNGNVVEYDINLEKMAQMKTLTKSMRKVHQFTMRIFNIDVTTDDKRCSRSMRCHHIGFFNSNT